jgi:CheY-like chemotaxis protein
VNQKTILLIDDDADLLQVIGDRCRKAGYQVEQARNLLTATATIEKHMPDIVCVDVQMPSGNGLSFCEMLATDPKSADLPIIVLTGQRDDETLKTCQRLKLEYVTKQADVWKTLELLLHKFDAQGRQRRTVPVEATGPLPFAGPQIPRLPTEPKCEGSPRAGGKLVVIADDDAELVRALSQRFSSMGCSVIGANSALEAVNAIHRVMPDLVCLDVNMPSGSGLSVCEMMATDERLRSVPVIILTGCSDQTTIRRCHDMLVFYVEKGTNVWSRIKPLVRELLHFEEPAQPKPKTPEKKSEPRQIQSAAARPVNDKLQVQVRDEKLMKNSPPPRDDGLMDAVFAMLGSGDGQSLAVAQSPEAAAEVHDAGPPWVLCIDDDQDYSDSIKSRLEQYGVAVARAYSGIEGYRMVFTNPASAILLDYNMPNGQGDYILDRLKRSPVTSHIPVIVITGVKDKVLERRMLAMGAAAFLNKPVAFERLRAELAQYIDILSSPPEPTLTTSR